MKVIELARLISERSSDYDLTCTVLLGGHPYVLKIESRITLSAGVVKTRVSVTKIWFQVCGTHRLQVV